MDTVHSQILRTSEVKEPLLGTERIYGRTLLSRYKPRTFLSHWSNKIEGKKRMCQAKSIFFVGVSDIWSCCRKLRIKLKNLWNDYWICLIFSRCYHFKICFFIIFYKFWFLWKLKKKNLQFFLHVSCVVSIGLNPAESLIQCLNKKKLKKEYKNLRKVTYV